MTMVRNWVAMACVVAVVAVTGPGTAVVGSAKADPIEITDIVGRKVVLERPAKRVLLGEGRDLFALSLLSPHPVDLIAGWLADLRRFDPVSYDQYREAFPQIDDIPMVGQTSADSFSVEKALALEPDLALFGGGHGPNAQSSDIVRQLEAAGIPVIFTDFRTDPLSHTVDSLRIMGQALGLEDRAEAFIALYEERRALIASRLSAAKVDAPNVLLEMRPTAERACCLSPGHGNLGSFIKAVGGSNIGEAVIPGALGSLNLEHVIASDPEIYIATGLPAKPGSGRLDIGAGVDIEASKASLRVLSQRTGVSNIKAVRSGRVFGLWHNFYNSPLNILALEALAKWIHPELFADLDPEATRAVLNSEFLAVPLVGIYWVALD